MTEKIVRTVPESDVFAWWEAGWTYVGPSEDPAFALVRWDRPRAPVQPLQDEEFTTLVGACAALEGRVA